MLARSLLSKKFNPVRVFSTKSWGNHDVIVDDILQVRKRDGNYDRIDKTRGFINYHRNPEPYREPHVRVNDWKEINYEKDTKEMQLERKIQASRCMDCGTPFCQTYSGCPVNNLIPEWNEFVFKDQWFEAYARLSQTNNFPEFTGRVCPAPCEGACVVGLVDKPVTIKNIENAIVERAFEEGWVRPRIPATRFDEKVAIIGSGPAGLAAADTLNQLGYRVTVFEREDAVGGLLMYGIPNMKLDKSKVTRRVNLLKKEGIEFVTNANIGVNIDVKDLQKEYAAMILCTGATMPRDLPVPGRQLNNIHFAMEFLTKNQKRLLMTKDGKVESAWGKSFVNAEGKNVIVIGGGDTGTDCIATAIRHRCKSVVNLELMPRPPDQRADSNPWPQYPRVYSFDYGHMEAKTVFGEDPRVYSVITKEFKDDGHGNVKSLVIQEVYRDLQTGQFVPIANSEKEIPADLVVLAMGFQSPEKSLLETLNVKVDAKRNAIDASKETNYQTNQMSIFAAGDCRRGQSLVVWAIHEGRDVAMNCANFLTEKRAATK